MPIELHTNHIVHPCIPAMSPCDTCLYRFPRFQNRTFLISRNVDFTLRTAPTFIKSRARNTIIITPTIIISPQRVIFVGTRSSIRFQLTLIGFQTYISGIIIAGVSRDGDRSIEGGEGGEGVLY